MNTIKLPPICPFGDDEDAAVFRLNDSRHCVWSLNETNDLFLRVSAHGDGGVYYHLAGRDETAQSLFDYCHELEDMVEFLGDSKELFAAWGFAWIVARCGNPPQ
jgi:hypothetical protein